MTEHAKQTWKALYADLGFSHTAFATWRKLEGAPTEPDREAWIRFIADKGLGETGNHVGGDREELLRQKLTREIAILDSKLDREHRRVISRDEVSRLLLHIATQQRSKLYQFLETEAPPKLDGLPAAQMRPLLREMADSICDTMAKLVEDFQSA